MSREQPDEASASFTIAGTTGRELTGAGTQRAYRVRQWPAQVTPKTADHDVVENSGRAAVAAFTLRLLTAAVVMAFTSTLFSLFIWTVLPFAVGWSPSVVMTGSMEPAIKPGDIVVTAPIEPSALQLGYVIRFRDPTNTHPYLLHRIVKINDGGTLMTKGDANQSDDSTPVPVANVTGVARLRIPVIGLPAVWLRNGQYLQLGLALLAVAVAAWVLSGFRALVADVRTATGPDPDRAGTDPVDGQLTDVETTADALTTATIGPADVSAAAIGSADVSAAAIGSADVSAAVHQPVEAGDATAARPVIAAGHASGDRSAASTD